MDWKKIANEADCLLEYDRQHREECHEDQAKPAPWVPKVGDAVMTGSHFVFTVTWTDGRELSVRQNKDSPEPISNFRPWKPEGR